MATTLINPLPEPGFPLRKRWTRAECDAMERAGLLEGQHLELIDGELINKMGKNQPHVVVLMELMGYLFDVFGRKRVSVEAPVDVAPQDNPTNEPEPDAMVLKAGFTHSRSRRPQAGQIALIVEVADTTLRFDLTVKAKLYARAGIEEYWVIDVNGRRIIVHRAPAVGVYGSVVAYAETQNVAPLAAPDQPLLVADLFV
jgi:Uma2 family endonuclease